MGRNALQRVSQREYARMLNVSNELVSRAVKTGQIKKGWDKAAGKIIVEHANVEWGALYMKQDIGKIIQQEPGQDYDSMPQSNNNPGSLTLNANSSFADAKKVGEILRAQLLGLQLKKEKGELVSKDEVYKQLFTYGQEIRVALLAIPDRIIDALLASRNRSEAYSLLIGEIHSALENLTKQDFNFQGRQ